MRYRRFCALVFCLIPPKNALFPFLLRISCICLYIKALSYVLIVFSVLFRLVLFRFQYIGVFVVNLAIFPTIYLDYMSMFVFFC